MQLPDWCDYIADSDQLAYARESVLASGNGRGNRIVEFNNGSGLAFTVHPDRALDIVECSFRGLPVVFRTPCGIHAKSDYEKDGFEWLRTWAGGLMTTCGLRSAGMPNGEFGLHGRISCTGAEDVGVRRELCDGRLRLSVRGVLRESRMFGENLRMERKISTVYGENTIEIHDRVENLAAEPDYVQLVYHCNFGYPAVSPEAELSASSLRIEPRDEHAAEGLSAWNRIGVPGSTEQEECFFHDIAPDADGFARMRLHNRKTGLAVAVAYDASTLPRCVVWKLAARKRYVWGIEPTNTFLKGRAEEIASGTAQKLEPGETRTFRVRFEFSQKEPER